MKKSVIIISFLLGTLSISLIVNVWLYNNNYQQYVKNQSLRLDPYELKRYPLIADIPNNKDKPLAVFLGDSRAEAWSDPSNTPFVFVNRGISGQTTEQILGRMSSHLSLLSPNVVIIQAGINDLRNIPNFSLDSQNIIINCKQNIQKIVNEIKNKTKSTIILTTIFPVGEPPIHLKPYWSPDVQKAVVEVNQFIRSLKSDRVIIFDAYTILSNQNGIINSKYSQDYLHLNNLGYTELNKELSQILNLQLQ
ncbi:SGNH/GDSL hydrolase family protein [Pseudanabaena sp. FACHB-1998]|uniref:SGNH/GDSL hydrolase family protein n=1 Tax=Pseudanabaena sp. FACHB-1998 TaxID=2692858 RepID=UPI00168167B0|nr:SGNH/GDSL hydrolase family protein [Pseudanabaena sp. FACHB-1998]MBD2178291.1 SGNH/GDSL hydrolase family protein [Pseudanabaena sp. FACHB-1998]